MKKEKCNVTPLALNVVFPVEVFMTPFTLSRSYSILLLYMHTRVWKISLAVNVFLVLAMLVKKDALVLMELVFYSIYILLLLLAICLIVFLCYRIVYPLVYVFILQCDKVNQTMLLCVSWYENSGGHDQYHTLHTIYFHWWVVHWNLNGLFCYISIEIFTTIHFNNVWYVIKVTPCFRNCVSEALLIYFMFLFRFM